MGSRQRNGEKWSRSKTRKDPGCCTEKSRLSPGAPGGDWRVLKLVVKNLPANAGASRDSGLIPGSGKSPGEGRGNLLQSSCLENPHGQRSLVGCNPWGCKEWDLMEQQSTRMWLHLELGSHAGCPVEIARGRWGGQRSPVDTILHAGHTLSLLEIFLVASGRSSS